MASFRSATRSRSYVKIHFMKFFFFTLKRSKGSLSCCQREKLTKCVLSSRREWVCIPMNLNHDDKRIIWQLFVTAMAFSFRLVGERQLKNLICLLSCAKQLFQRIFATMDTRDSTLFSPNVLSKTKRDESCSQLVIFYFSVWFGHFIIYTVDNISKCI